MIGKAVLSAALFMVSILAPLSSSFAEDAPKGQPAGDPVRALPAELLDATWQWTWFGSGAEQFDVDHPENYTLLFLADGTAAIEADCNRGTAQYSLAEDNRITLAPIAVTMMLCPNPSLEAKFLGALEKVVIYFQMDGDFFLELPISSGTLRFRREAAD